jgi:hypothetical protein
MTDAPRQPWAKETGAVSNDTYALEVALRQLNEAADKRHQQLLVFLTFVPLLWGGMWFVAWRWILIPLLRL